jgi:hypothetical protein
MHSVRKKYIDILFLWLLLKICIQFFVVQSMITSMAKWLVTLFGYMSTLMATLNHNRNLVETNYVTWLLKSSQYNINKALLHLLCDQFSELYRTTEPTLDRWSSSFSFVSRVSAIRFVRAIFTHSSCLRMSLQVAYKVKWSHKVHI